MLPGATQEMVNVVSLVRGTVAAPPESLLSLKLAPEELTAQESTFFVLQKIDARKPSETDPGTAQISTFGSPAGVCGTEYEDDVAAVLLFGAGCDAAGGGGGGAGVPT